MLISYYVRLSNVCLTEILGSEKSLLRVVAQET